MLVEKIEIGQVWQKDNNRIVIIDVEKDTFYAVDLNGFLLKNKAFEYLEDADCLSEENNDWFSVFEKQKNKKEFIESIDREELIKRAGGVIFISEAANITTPTLYRWIRTGKVSERVKNRIDFVLKSVLK